MPGLETKELAVRVRQEFGNSYGRSLEINPEPIELSVIGPSEERAIIMGQTRKAMWGFFVLLAEAKIARGLRPLITRGELAKHTPFSPDQLYDYFFSPLKEIGVLELSPSGKGYLLACRPSDVREALSSENGFPYLEAPGFENWLLVQYPDVILIDEYLVPIVQAIYLLYQKVPKDSFISWQSLGNIIERSRDVVYDQLQRLEDLRVIKRQEEGGRYRVGDVDWRYVDQAAPNQKKRIALKVRGIPKISDSKILRINEEEGLTFPELSWQEAEVKLSELGSVESELWELINLVLKTDLKGGVVRNERDEMVLVGNLPFLENLEQPVTLMILEFLGLGPREIKRLPETTATLEEAILDWEKSRHLQDHFLVAEIKRRLLNLIFGASVPAEEASEYSFATLMANLEELCSREEEAKEEKKQEEKITEAVPERKEKVVAEVSISSESREPSEQLLALIKGPLETQIRTVLSKGRPFIKPLKPLQASRVHTILSQRTEKVPWDDLEKLGLLVRFGTDQHHPRVTPAGALVAVLALNSDVWNLASVNGSGVKALQAIARHAAHLLTIRFQGVKGRREEEYLKACLSNLRSADLLCQCRECSELIKTILEI